MIRQVNISGVIFSHRNQNTKSKEMELKMIIQLRVGLDLDDRV